MSGISGYPCPSLHVLGEVLPWPLVCEMASGVPPNSWSIDRFLGVQTLFQTSLDASGVDR